MSGHSKWKTIKHKKEAADSKRGKVFSKLSRQITAAAKQGGPDPDKNSSLRFAIEQARGLNMPNENIERAIQKSVTNKGDALEELLLEGFGPGGTAVLVEAITDNKNRTVGEVRQMFAKHSGKLSEEGSVRWLFERRGVLQVRVGASALSREEVELAAIDAGAQDTSIHEDALDVICDPGAIDSVRMGLSQKGVKVEEAGVDWVAKEYVDVDQEHRTQLESFFEELDELDDVQEIYTNAKL